MTRPTDTERLFFALYPSETVRQSLQIVSQTVTQGLKGRVIPSDNLHITLIFLGETKQATKYQIQQTVATLQSDAFQLQLDEIGYWPKSGILWLAPHQLPTDLLALVDKLTHALKPFGYQLEERPYQAHITLMRQTIGYKRTPSISPIIWPVADFCLVRSKLERKNTPTYTIIARWPLNVVRPSRD